MKLSEGVHKTLNKLRGRYQSTNQNCIKTKAKLNENIQEGNITEEEFNNLFTEKGEIGEIQQGALCLCVLDNFMYQFSHMKDFKDIILKNIRRNLNNAYEIRIPFNNGKWIEVSKKFLKQKEDEEIKIIKSRGEKAPEGTTPFSASLGFKLLECDYLKDKFPGRPQKEYHLISGFQMGRVAKKFLGDIFNTCHLPTLKEEAIYGNGGIFSEPPAKDQLASPKELTLSESDLNLLKNQEAFIDISFNEGWYVLNENLQFDSNGSQNIKNKIEDGKILLRKGHSYACHYDEQKKLLKITNPHNTQEIIYINPNYIGEYARGIDIYTKK